MEEIKQDLIKVIQTTTKIPYRVYYQNPKPPFFEFGNMNTNGNYKAKGELTSSSLNFTIYLYSIQNILGLFYKIQESLIQYNKTIKKYKIMTMDLVGTDTLNNNVQMATITLSIFFSYNQ